MSKQLYLCSNAKNCPDPECPCRVPHEPEDFGGGDTCIDESVRAEVCHRTNIHCECLPIPVPMDKWDILIIRHLKSFNQGYKHLQNIWSHRCALEMNYVRMADITEHLVNLVEEFKLTNLKNFLRLLKDSEQGHLVNYGDYDNHVFNACCSLLTNARTDQLVGYIPPLRYKLFMEKQQNSLDKKSPKC